MGAAALNALDLYKQFEKAGVSEPQARLFADLFARSQKTEDLATKSDVEKDFKTFEVGQDRKFDQLRHAISETRQELKSEIEQASNKLDNKINNLKFDIAKWMIGLFFAQASLTAAVITSIKIFG